MRGNDRRLLDSINRDLVDCETALHKSRSRVGDLETEVRQLREEAVESLAKLKEARKATEDERLRHEDTKQALRATEARCAQAAQDVKAAEQLLAEPGSAVAQERGRIAELETSLKTQIGKTAMALTENSRLKEELRANLRQDTDALKRATDQLARAQEALEKAVAGRRDAEELARRYKTDHDFLTATMTGGWRGIYNLLAQMAGGRAGEYREWSNWAVGGPDFLLLCSETHLTLIPRARAVEGKSGQVLISMPGHFANLTGLDKFAEATERLAEKEVKAAGAKLTASPNPPAPQGGQANGVAVEQGLNKKGNPAHRLCRGCKQLLALDTAHFPMYATGHGDEGFSGWCLTCKPIRDAIVAECDRQSPNLAHVRQLLIAAPDGIRQEPRFRPYLMPGVVNK